MPQTSPTPVASNTISFLLAERLTKLQICARLFGYPRRAFLAHDFEDLAFLTLLLPICFALANCFN
jgi:hypothetical protein